LGIDASTLLLDTAAPAFFFDALAPGCSGGSCFAPRFGFFSGPSHQTDQALAGIPAVLVPGAKPIL
jgi:hypothetical protein